MWYVKGYSGGLMENKVCTNKKIEIRRIWKRRCVRIFIGSLDEFICVMFIHHKAFHLWNFFMRECHCNFKQSNRLILVAVVSNHRLLPGSLYIKRTGTEKFSFIPFVLLLNLNF